MIKEIWKDIPGYEGKYQVSNLGRVRALNYNRTGSVKIRIPRLGRGGYLYLSLWAGGKSKTMKIHRLVASAFISNPFNYPQVNHKDEDKLNNRADNLEWCSASYNNSYGRRPRKVLDAHKNNGSPKAERAVVKVDISGTIIEEFVSISDAARKVGVSRESLRDAVLGKSKTCKGFKWKYKQ